jgi:gliding motility-associated-like protein
MTLGTSYTVIARENGCDSNPSAAFSNAAQTAPPAAPTISNTPASCTANGSSTISNYNASLTYTFTPTGSSVGAGGAISNTTIGTSYTIVASDGSCSSSPSAAFSNAAQLAAPVAAITGSLTYCTGGNTTLTASGGGTYAWFNLSGNNIGNTASVTVTQGSYAVLVTAANGCLDTATAVVTELTSLTVSISGTLSYCPGGNTTLTASGGVSYVWSNTNTTASTTVTAGTYTVTGTDANGCTGTASATVIQNNAPIITISGTLSYCAGSNTTLTASGAASYVWSDINGTTTPTITVTLGNYTVIGTDANGCTADASISVNENALPLVIIDGLLNYCVGGNTTLTATGGNTYLWSTGDVTDAITVTQGNFDVTATDANGCTGTASATVTEIANLIVNINGVLTHCPSSNTVLTAEGGTSYIWSNGSTTDSVVVTAGTYTVTATDATCTGTASVTVTELSTTPVSLGNDIAVCEDSSVTIDASNGYVSYLWNTGDTTQTLTPLTDGTYSITATDANGCTVADSVDVVFSPFPVVDLGIDTTIFAGSSYTLSPVITPASTGSVSYSWQPDSVLSCADCATTVITAEDTTVVTLVYTDAFGCVVSDSVVISTSSIVPIFIPNAFSPNRDGQNELFQIYGGAFKEFYMAIHNRWGQKVFESKDFSQAWDGTFNGKEQEQGVYVYYLKIVSADLRINTLKGSVTLLR